MAESAVLHATDAVNLAKLEPQLTTAKAQASVSFIDHAFMVVGRPVLCGL